MADMLHSIVNLPDITDEHISPFLLTMIKCQTRTFWSGEASSQNTNDTQNNFSAPPRKTPPVVVGGKPIIKPCMNGLPPPCKRGKGGNDIRDVCGSTSAFDSCTDRKNRYNCCQFQAAIWYCQFAEYCKACRAKEQAYNDCVSRGGTNCKKLLDPSCRSKCGKFEQDEGIYQTISAECYRYYGDGCNLGPFPVGFPTCVGGKPTTIPGQQGGGGGVGRGVPLTDSTGAVVIKPEDSGEIAINTDDQDLWKNPPLNIDRNVERMYLMYPRITLNKSSDTDSIQQEYWEKDNYPYPMAKVSMPYEW